MNKVNTEDKRSEDPRGTEPHLLSRPLFAAEPLNID